jgi:hypothetical protein
MTGAAPPGRRPDWSGLIVPTVLGGVFVAFYASLLGAPAIDRVFITPLMSAGAIVLAAVVWQQLRPAQERPGAPAREEALPVAEPWRLVGFIAMMVVYFLGLTYVGFFVSSLAMIVCGMLWLGVRSPVQLGMVPIALVAIEYLLFAIVLEIPFPQSSIGLF